MEKPSGCTSDSPAALVLSPEAPFPVVGGGQARTASLIEYLGRRMAVDVIVFRESHQPDPALAFPPGLVRTVHTLTLPRSSRRLLLRAARNLGRLFIGVPPLNHRFRGFAGHIGRILAGRRYDFAIIEHFWCAEYAALLAPHTRELILDLHNIESALFASSAQAEDWPQAALFEMVSALCLRWEQKLFPRFSLLLTTSEADAARVRAIAPGPRTAVYPNAIPEQPVPDAAETNSIVFSGNLEYHPNSLAVRYFHREIWPALSRRFPELRWRLLGRNAQAVRPIVGGDDRVELVDTIENPVYELSRSRVVVIPLRSGSGTRVKLLEAWAAQRAVVSTTIGAEGMPAQDGENILIADHAGDFVEAVSRLLESEELRRRLGRNGRLTYQRLFTWPAAWKILGDLQIFAR